MRPVAVIGAGSWGTALAIATLTIAINLVVDDVSAHAGGRLAKRMI